jgi:hypothetical protein
MIAETLGYHKQEGSPRAQQIEPTVFITHNSIETEIEIIQPCSFAFVLLLIFSLSFAAKERKFIFWYTQARSPYAILRARRKKKQKFGEPSRSRSRPRERTREVKRELAEREKQNALLKFLSSTRLCSCHLCSALKQCRSFVSNRAIDINPSPWKDVNPTKGTSQLSSCSLHSLIGQAS